VFKMVLARSDMTQALTAATMPFPADARARHTVTDDVTPVATGKELGKCL
jgi:hypothetical protein